MIEKGEKTVGIQKNIKWAILLAIAVLVLWQAVFNVRYWETVQRGIFRNDLGRMEVERFAGCQPKTMMEEVSDEDFSTQWKKSSDMYNFNYFDIKYHMESICPPESDFEIESNYGSGYRGRVRVEKVKKCVIIKTDS
jgi:hypothetical protein